MSVRVIAGVARGRKLKVPPAKGVRPTSDRARETLFNVLGDRVPGCRFLDVFAGSGAVGVEALSRGAAEVVFIESTHRTAAIVVDNVSMCGFEDRAEVLRARWRQGLRRLAAEGRRFEVAFFDPPYDWPDAHMCLEEVAGGGLLAESGIAVIEHRKDTPPRDAAGWELKRRIDVGDTSFSVFGIIPTL